MRVLLVLCALTAIAFGSESFNSKQINRSESNKIPGDLYHGYFTTKLDNFRPRDPRKIEFSYYANFDHYIPGGPFYIYIKDAIDQSTTWIESGLMVDIARDTKGALFTFDQRFFGSNIPTDTLSFENLQYLTVDQALFDIATFITFIHERHQGDYSKKILWGSGTGATLATWARKKYSHLVDAVWSSSGIFALDVALTSPHELLEYALYSVGGEECLARVKSVFNLINDMVNSGNGDYLQSRMNLCKPVDTKSMYDVAALFESHLDFITQYIDKYHSTGIENFCKDLKAYENDVLDSFVRWASFVYGNEDCFDHSYSSFIERNKNEIWNIPYANTGERQLYYLQCTQLGMFEVTDNETWVPNRVPLDYHLQACKDIFGVNYSSTLLPNAVEYIVYRFGSIYQRVTNIIYTNGGIDTWFYSGVVAAIDYDSHVININYHSKSADLPSLTEYDTTNLVNAKAQIKQLVTKWSRR